MIFMYNFIDSKLMFFFYAKLENLETYERI